MKVLFFISKKRINKKGLSPIYCRITVNGKRSEISTGLFINPANWKGETMNETTENGVLINVQLSKIRNDLNRIYIDLSLKEKIFNSNRVKEIYLGNGKTSYNLLELMSEFLEYKYKSITELNTIKTYKARSNNLVQFLSDTKRKQLLPDEFNLGMADNFMHYLRKNKKLSTNYINKNFGFLKSVLTYGLRMDYISVNPLALLNLKHDKPKPIVSLTKKELQHLMTYKFVSERLQTVADLYIFQSYTGFSYVDLTDFDFNKHTQLIGFRTWIFKTRVKVDAEAIIPLFQQARRILKKYNYQLPTISNQKYNAYLKEITDITGIKKNLTTHTARKTFAMLKLDEGYSIESVAKMMGHNSVKITQSTYATIGTTRIENETRRLRIK